MIVKQLIWQNCRINRHTILFNNRRIIFWHSTVNFLDRIQVNCNKLLNQIKIRCDLNKKILKQNIIFRFRIKYKVVQTNYSFTFAIKLSILEFEISGLAPGAAATKAPTAQAKSIAN